MAAKRTLADFETHDLLEAVDHLDQIRGILADGPQYQPLQIRVDLLKLHGLAMLCNEGGNNETELIELATDIEYEIEEIRDAADWILEVLRGLTEAEEMEFDDDPDDDDDDELGSVTP